MSSKKKPTHRVTTIVHRNDKAFFVEIGAAWPTESGNGYLVRLDALPIGDTIILSTKRERNATEEPAAD